MCLDHAETMQRLAKRDHASIEAQIPDHDDSSESSSGYPACYAAEADCPPDSCDPHALASAYCKLVSSFFSQSSSYCHCDLISLSFFFQGQYCQTISQSQGSTPQASSSIARLELWRVSSSRAVTILTGPQPGTCNGLQALDCQRRSLTHSCFRSEWTPRTITRWNIIKVSRVVRS